MTLTLFRSAHLKTPWDGSCLQLRNSSKIRGIDLTFTRDGEDRNPETSRRKLQGRSERAFKWHLLPVARANFIHLVSPATRGYLEPPAKKGEERKSGRGGHSYLSVSLEPDNGETLRPFEGS